MKKFSELFGLEFNYSKTGNVFLTEDDFSYEDSQIAAKLPPGAVTIGFLNLDSKSGEWVIDQKKVDAHVKQLSKQLANAPSILSWVQTWNSCIGRFFSHTFGEPAKCFGRAHVDAVLETYKRMQEKLFPGSDVCEFLKGQIKDRFGVIDIPDAFIFIPEDLGGLGVRNPFIGALMSRENVGSGPSDYLQTVLSDERETYNSLKHAFDSTDLQERKRRLQTNYIDAFGETLLPENSSKDLNTFLSFSEFTAHRECTSVELFKAYNALMASPPKQAIHSTQGVDTAIRTLVLAIPDGEKERGGLKEELRWILQMYESELMERCGGMSCVDKELLPLGVLTILRKRRVAWQMVL